MAPTSACTGLPRTQCRCRRLASAEPPPRRRALPVTSASAAAAAGRRALGHSLGSSVVAAFRYCTWCPGLHRCAPCYLRAAPLSLPSSTACPVPLATPSCAAPLSPTTTEPPACRQLEGPPTCGPGTSCRVTHTHGVACADGWEGGTAALGGSA